MRRLIIITPIFCLLFVSCKKIKDPVFNRITNVKIGKLGLGSSQVGFDVEYFNPNNKGGKLKEASGDAWLDSNYLGHFHVDSLIDIPANANFLIPVKLDVDMKYMLKYSLTGFKNEDVLVMVKGTAKVGKGGIYKNFPINYEGRQNLALLVK
jgi:hypothetical protein